MHGDFDFFVILGDMRTGSNLLEESLDAFDGLTCHGEVFNPGFAGHEGQLSLFGMTVAERDRDPLAMIALMRAASEGIPGFRLFPGHDPRVLEHCLRERRCAKVVLARNPVDSYVSLKIARKTGQWWLGDMRAARSATVRFEPEEFESYLQRLQSFYGQIRRSLQTSGQTAFHVHYDDLSDPAVLDGLARVDRHHGLVAAKGPCPRAEPRTARRPRSRTSPRWRPRLAVQMRSTSTDFRTSSRVAGRTCRHGWLRTRSAFSSCHWPGGRRERVVDWLTTAGGGPPRAGFTRKSLHLWMRSTPGHRRFTVVSHPLRRAHDVFVRKILDPGPEGFPDIRAVLRDRYGLDLPDDLDGFGPARHRAAFLGFLQFLKGNLSGQTSVRVPAAWASQAALVAALAEIAPPDMVLRAEAMDAGLSSLRPGLPPVSPEAATPLDTFYDPEIENAARAAYARDYLTFGYGNWR